MLRAGKREQYYYRMLHVEIFCGDSQCVGANGVVMLRVGKREQYYYRILR